MSQRQLLLALSQVHDQSGPLDRYLSRQHVDGVLLLSCTARTHCPRTCSNAAFRRCWEVGQSGCPGSATSTSTTSAGPGKASNTWQRRAAPDCDDRRPAGHGGRAGPVAGYRDVLTQHGLATGPELIAYGDFSQRSGQQAMRELLDRVPDMDAVFAANDPMAAGALQVLKERGRRVPVDVAVVGFDDAPMAQFTDPPLTSVHQSAEQMGREMVALLFEQVDDGAAAGACTVLSTELVRRVSG